MRWRPIKTAPKDGTHIMVWCRGDQNLNPHIATYSSFAIRKSWLVAHSFDVLDDSGNYGRPTHWMSLPKKPRGYKKKPRKGRKMFDDVSGNDE